jgi:hypothetical protein
MGEEPTAKDVESSLLRTLTWYHSMCEVPDAIEYLSDYLIARDRKDEAKALKRVPECWIPMTAAWLSRIDGDRFTDRIEPFLAVALTYAQPEVIRQPRTGGMSIQDRMKEKVNNVIGEIEALIDSDESFMVYDFLRKLAIPGKYMPQIIQYYQPYQVELHAQVFGQKDEGAKEKLAMINILLRDLEKYRTQIKVVKKSKKIKNKR